MDKTILAYTLSGDLDQELALEGLPKDQAANDIRPLADWEMVLVGGGEDVPVW